MEKENNNSPETHIYNKHALEEQAKNLTNLNEKSDLTTETQECHEIPPMVTQTTVSSENFEIAEGIESLNPKSKSGEFSDTPQEVLVQTQQEAKGKDKKKKKKKERTKKMITPFTFGMVLFVIYIAITVFAVSGLITIFDPTNIENGLAFVVLFLTILPIIIISFVPLLVDFIISIVLFSVSISSKIKAIRVISIIMIVIYIIVLVALILFTVVLFNQARA